VQAGHGLVHAEHHPLVSGHVGWLASRSVVVEEVRRHVFEAFARVNGAIQAGEGADDRVIVLRTSGERAVA
jgi:hypothetical protein